MIKNEKGYTLVTVLLVILLLTVVGGAYIFAMNFEVRESFRHDHRVQAYYFGRSGAEAASEWFILNKNQFLEFDEDGNIDLKEEQPTSVDENLIISINGNIQEEGLRFSGSQEGDNIEIKIYLDQVVSREEVIIESIGKYSQARENVSLVLDLRKIKGNAFDKAVYSDGDIDASQPPGIRIFEDEEGQGGVQSAGSVYGQDRIEGEIIENTNRFYPPPEETKTGKLFDADETTLWKTISAGNNDYSPEDPKILGEVYYYDEITSQSQGTITFTIDCENGGDENYIVLFINELNSKGVFDVTCGCPEENINCFVIMYVKGDATLQTPNAGNEVPIFLYLEDGANLELIAGSTFNGYIYGPGATVQMISNTHIEGAIIVDKLMRNWQQDSFIGTIAYQRIELFDEYFKDETDYYTAIGINRKLWK